MQPVNFVDLPRQYLSIKDELDEAVLATLASGRFILGAEVARFEEEWAAACGVRHCVGVSSGTAALALAYECAGIRPGDEVIAPANTFIATILPAARMGARIVLVDCDELGQIDVARARDAITPATRAVAGVHLFGHPCDADAIAALCREHDLVFVEDAAQAHGALYHGRPCGSLGDIGVFSFYPGKNLGAAGDAGAVVTDDGDLSERLRILRDLGQAQKYEHVALGSNERLDAIHAAVLRVKLRHLAEWNEARRSHAAAYGRLLEGAVTLPPAAPWATPVWHLYVVRAANRDELRGALDDAGIATGLHYPVPLHLQPALASLGHHAGDFPAAEEWARTSLSLPMFPELRAEEIERVAEVVRRVAVAPS